MLTKEAGKKNLVANTDALGGNVFCTRDHYLGNPEPVCGLGKRRHPSNRHIRSWVFDPRIWREGQIDKAGRTVGDELASKVQRKVQGAKWSGSVDTMKGRDDIGHHSVASDWNADKECCSRCDPSRSDINTQQSDALAELLVNQHPCHSPTEGRRPCSNMALPIEKGQKNHRPSSVVSS